MDPMLFVVVFDAMQRQLDENARLRLRHARAEVAERRHPLRTLGAALAPARPAPRHVTLAPADATACCPA